MKTITLAPGSTEWVRSRSASKAPAMMGCDQKTSRSELLRMMATGLGKEFTDWQQKNLLDKGHVSEIGARDIAEDILCDGLSPTCCATDDDYLTAAPDGATFAGNIGFEAKAWNEKTAAFVRDGVVPDYHAWQLDQQILVCGFEYVLFMVTDGTREKCVSMEYRSTPERAKKLLAAWRQFDADLANYQHVEAAPVVTAAPVKDLPAIIITSTGSLTVETNFAAWGKSLREFIDKIPEKPSTDQEFADCKAAVAALKRAEEMLDAEEARVLSAIPDVDEMKRDKKLLWELSSTTRLALEKLVVQRDKDVKIEITQAGKDALAEHITGLNKRLATVQMPPIAADFAAAIKNKRSYDKMREAVADLVATKKIESSGIADKIDANLKLLDAAKEHAFLFHDRATLVMKDAETLALYIKSRITEHQAIEAKRLEAIKEAARIEAEKNAAAKVKAESDAKAKAEQDAAEAQRLAGIAAAEKIERDRLTEANQTRFEEPAAPTAPGPSSARLDETPMAAAPDDGARIRLGEIGERLGFQVTADFIASLGFQPVETIKAAKMYRESEFPAIVASLIVRLEGVLAKDWRAAA